MTSSLYPPHILKIPLDPRHSRYPIGRYAKARSAPVLDSLQQTQNLKSIPSYFSGIYHLRDNHTIRIYDNGGTCFTKWVGGTVYFPNHEGEEAIFVEYI